MLLNTQMRSVEDLAPTYEFSLEPARGCADLGALWQDLERRADASFLQSWAWVGCWLDMIPDSAEPQLMLARYGGEVVALALFCPGRLSRHGFVRSRALLLGQTGDQQEDCLTIEYNGILVDRRFGFDLVRQCIRWIGRQPDWEELFLAGVDPSYERLAGESGLRLRVYSDDVWRAVDLDAARAKGDFLSLLGSKTRYRVRRAVRRYEEQGKVTIAEASSVEQALDWLGRLKELHQASWIARGKPGSYAIPFFERFHRELIRREFANGATQLLRIAVGEEEIGYLYNFVHGGRIYHYQSGLNYRERRQPGLVAHYMSVGHFLKGKESLYDFMAGDSEYKSSLSQVSGRMIWAVMQKPRLKYRVEDALRSAHHRLRLLTNPGANAANGSSDSSDEEG